jgi:hypothetical protein
VLIAGGTACATKKPVVFAVVGQAVPPAASGQEAGPT